MTQRANGKKDEEAEATLRALRRAARRALEEGARTGTPVYVIRDNRIVDLTKEDRRVHRHSPKQRKRVA